MTDCRTRTRFVADTAAIVRNDERLVRFVLPLLSVAVPAVFLHDATLV